MTRSHSSIILAILCRTLQFAVLSSALLQFAFGATLENSALYCATSNGDGSLSELRDIATGHNLLASPAHLWELQLAAGRKTITLGPAQASSFHFEPLPGRTRGYRLTWDKFGPPVPTNLVISVVVTLDELDANSRWRIAVSGIDRPTLRQVRFPIVQNLAPQPGEHVAVPMWMGQVAPEPRSALTATNGQPRRLQWDYPGALSMQCLTYWGDRAGLYLATDDTESFRKAFAITTDGKGALGCDVVHWPETMSGTQWELPYHVLLGTYRGDWFTAAERYRTWATNQVWAVRSRLATKAVPQWVSDTALWVWNRGRSDGVLQPAIELRERLGLPVSVFWHWWHGCAYDTGFPEYLPPREGTGRFRGAVARAEKQDVHALAYMNQRLWGMTTHSWTNTGAAAWAVKGEDGKIHPEIYNTFNHAPCASMCLGTKFWRNTYAGLAEQAVRELGLSGIYMDQACLSLSCYDPAHGHPVGGGTYWLNGFRLLAGDIRQRCAPMPARGPSARTFPALAGEGCGEPWLSQLDLMLSLQVSKERYAGPDGWDTIPFFHAVYHPYAVLFGNYSSLTMPPYDELWPAEFAPKEPLKLLDRAYSSQFRLEQARAFVWGQQPTLANFTPGQLRTRASEISYVLTLAKLRQSFARYLLHGTMLRPPALQVAQRSIPMSRLSIYAGQQGGLRAFEKPVPLAIAAAWRAPGGSVAIALASIADEPLQLRLTIPAHAYAVPAGASIWRTDQGGRKNIGTIGAGPEAPLSFDLPAHSACILEFKAD